jgi:hypothetical protein
VRIFVPLLWPVVCEGLCHRWIFVPFAWSVPLLLYQFFWLKEELKDTNVHFECEMRKEWMEGQYIWGMGPIFWVRPVTTKIGAKQKWWLGAIWVEENWRQTKYSHFGWNFNFGPPILLPRLF